MLYGRFRYRWRVTAGGQVVPPATCVISNRKRRGEKGASFRLTQRWIDWIEANNSEKGVRNVLGKSRGWVNGLGVAESVGFGGNIFEILWVEDNFARLNALQPESPLPQWNDPLFSHLLTAVTPSNQPRLFADGVRAWHPFLVNGEAWVWLGDIEVFSQRPEPRWPGGAPADLAGYAAVVVKGSVVRQSAGGPKIYVMTADTIVRVISEVNGWAKIGEKRWVELGRVRPVAA